MKRFLLFVICWVFAFTATSQTTQFSYDASGNRIARWLDVKELKQAESDSLEKVFKGFKLLNGELLADMRLFPNPVKQELTIEIPNLSEASATAILSDINGRQLMRFEALGSVNQLNLSVLAPGTYLLRIECQGERKVWKVVKE